MQTMVAEVLAAWRRAERLAEELPEGTPDQAAALAACERLRDLYRELTATGIVSEEQAQATLAELQSGGGSPT